MVTLQPNLKVSEAPTASLVPYVGNAKEHPEWQVEQIANSIEQFGFNDPVGVWHYKDGNPVIVEGHGRVLAAKMLGIESVPVVTLDHLDDEGRRAYTLAHNKLTTNTGYDEETLAAELASIVNIDMTELGFDESELSSLEDIDEVVEDEPPTFEQVEERVKVGELWRMGEHFLLCGDATNIDDVAKVLGGG